jgi:Protein of unknown function (DUF2806)
MGTGDGMPADDPLDKEISVGAEITESGVKANARSRTLAAIDRLCGNLVDRLNIPIERSNAHARAVMLGEQRLIEAVAQYGIERLSHDPDFARRAAEQHFKRVFKAQENTDAVVREAIDHLATDPPSDFEAHSGRTDIDSSFLDSFERYAAGASTEELRLKWARVLSSEIRKPGTFSTKVLRIVDELEARTAQEFERLAASRLDDVLPKALVGDLNFQEVGMLTTAGLVHDPGLTGHIRLFADVQNDGGDRVRFVQFGTRGISLRSDATIATVADVIQTSDKGLALPVYVLTDVGKAVATILPDKEGEALNQLIHKLKGLMPDLAITEYRRQPEDQRFRVIGTF